MCDSTATLSEKWRTNFIRERLCSLSSRHMNQNSILLKWYFMSKESIEKLYILALVCLNMVLKKMVSLKMYEKQHSF